MKASPKNLIVLFLVFASAAVRALSAPDDHGPHRLKMSGHYSHKMSHKTKSSKKMYTYAMKNSKWKYYPKTY